MIIQTKAINRTPSPIIPGIQSQSFLPPPPSLSVPLSSSLHPGHISDKLWSQISKLEAPLPSSCSPSEFPMPQACLGQASGSFRWLEAKKTISLSFPTPKLCPKSRQYKKTTTKILKPCQLETLPNILIHPAKMLPASSSLLPNFKINTVGLFSDKIVCYTVRRHPRRAWRISEVINELCQNTISQPIHVSPMSSEGGDRNLKATSNIT